MTQMAETTTSLIDQRPSDHGVSDWLASLRQVGAATFHEFGLPGPREEAWRQTNLKPLRETDFTLATGSATPDATLLKAYDIPGLDGPKLVFVDGAFNAEHSRIEQASGVQIRCLSDALANDDQTLQKYMAQYAKADADVFTALNTAYLSDGAYVHVSAKHNVAQPVHLLFVSTRSDTPTMSHPRVLIVVEQGAKATVVEQHVGPDDNVYFTNAVTEVVVGDEADATHYFIEQDGNQAINVSTLQIHQGANSMFASHTLLLGGGLVRNNVRPTLAGADSFSLLNGLYLPDGNRLLDNHMHVHHQQPNCESRQYYTGILRDRGKGVFVGRILVDRPAQKTDAVQESKNLLLSPDAHAHNQPQLEIFADDVKCTHGSTTGELDEKAVFYLRARGIPEPVARGLMIYAFAAETLERMKLEPVRHWLGRLLVKELGLSDDVQQVLSEETD